MSLKDVFGYGFKTALATSALAILNTGVDYLEKDTKVSMFLFMFALSIIGVTIFLVERQVQGKVEKRILDSLKK